MPSIYAGCCRCSSHGARADLVRLTYAHPTLWRIAHSDHHPCRGHAGHRRIIGLDRVPLRSRKPGDGLTMNPDRAACIAKLKGSE